MLARARTSEVAVDEYRLNPATSEIRLNSDGSGGVLRKEHVGKRAGGFSAIHSESRSASTNGDASDRERGANESAAKNRERKVCVGAVNNSGARARQGNRKP